MIELMNFKEALIAAIEGEKIDVYPGSNWSHYEYFFTDPEEMSGIGFGHAALIDESGIKWWPTKNQQKICKWHVKPEEKAPGDIFVGEFARRGGHR